MTGDGAEYAEGTLRRAWNWFLDRLTVDWDELEEVEDDCPNCGSEKYRKEPSKIPPNVYRCRDCRAEGVRIR